MKSNRTGIVYILLCCIIGFAAAQTSEEGVMTSSSQVDWSKSRFYSTISMDIEKAAISLPSGRGTAVDRIEMVLPQLIKDGLFSLPADSSANLGDIILQGILPLSKITQILNNGQKTASFFSSDMKTLSVKHSVSLADIGALMVLHNAPYTLKKPLEIVPSRPYTGIIIDARGALNVHGEYTTAQTVPALFPRIWDDTMELLYEKNMVLPSIVKQQGLAVYSSSIDEKEYQKRIGKDPLRITAREVYGFNRTDPVISRKDALKILTVSENLELLKQGRVVILIDQPLLVHQVEAPVKDDQYYFAYGNISDYFIRNHVPDITVTDTYKGITISIKDIHFAADSDQILTEDIERLGHIAAALKEALSSGKYTILAEGHTASVGKPAGEMQLSIDRAKRIVDEMVKRGLSAEMFTYAGHGGTIPTASNDTAEGRAENRRVELTIKPASQ